MTDIAGLVVSVVTAWKICVEVFDILDSGKKYGMDYEILRIKLEVERIRLLTWGDAVGLSEVERSRSSPDPRLNRNDTRRTVLHLLGCIQYIFEHTERLQDRYGLRPVTPTIRAIDEEPPTQSQLILGSIFKRAYNTLRQSANDRQRLTPLQKKMKWAIHDKKKFQEMVSEIKGFNDNLQSLFPDIQRYASEAMANDIDQSNDIDALQSLQEATSDDHEDIAATASVRLEAIGATASRISEDRHTITGEVEVALRPGTVNPEADADTEGNALEELDEVSKRMEVLELYVSKKSKGTLSLSLIGPDSYSEHVSANVYWDGTKVDDPWTRWHDEEKGFLKNSHASFDLYHRKGYIKRNNKSSLESYTDEDHVLLDVESNPKYENVNPGTVTVEGFGMECWDYELVFGKKRDNTILISNGELPNVSAKKLLRRIDELRCGVNKFGWNPQQEGADLKEFFGQNLNHIYSGTERDNFLAGNFYSLLNRRDIFADFTSQSSIALTWGGPEEESIGMWNFLWQIILAKELVLRRQHYGDGSWSLGFTPRVLASLIVQDLWFRSVEIILTDSKIISDEMKRPKTAEERVAAEGFKSEGNEAMAKKQWQDAVDFYTKAIKADSSNVVYFANRSAAYHCMGKYDEARNDAYIATQLDPNYAKAWARLGLAEKNLDNGKRARDAYKRAIEVAGKDVTSLMKQGLADARAKINADLKAIDEESDKAAKNALVNKYLDEDWDIACKTVELHSHVHEQQVEGLLLFAERMKWPYINEVRDYAEDVYGNLRSGQTVPFHLHDWLFGMMLPGKWMSFKIMAVLVLCTPSISTSLGVAHYYDCGLLLPKRSYWRVRTVLGRVLGSLPGLISLCGWVGPCPAVEFVPHLSEDAKKEPRYISLKTRRVAPMEYTPDEDNGVNYLGRHRAQYETTRMRPDEDIPAYLAEMKDDKNWVIPEPPVRELSTCTIQSIRLKKLPLDINIVARRANKELSEKEVDNEAEYRASIVFTMDNNEGPITYTLYTNPVFVTPPPCHPGPKGVHEVHIRELPIYQKNVWTADRLKDHTPEDFDGDIMIINATGKGAETLARAWCSERGRNAIIRRAGGPCFVCAVRAASKAGLATGVLIWSS